MQQAELHKPNVTSNVIQDESDFSLVAGGPLYQLYLRTGLARPALERVFRRIAGLSLMCWLPPLLLTLMAGHFYGGLGVPFLLDAEVHTRFFGTLPLLIGSELIVHRRMQTIVRQFLDRGIIAKEDQERFEGALASAMRLRNSVVVELVLLLLVVSVGHWVWKLNLTLGVSTWYAVNAGGETRLTAAGYWYAFVGLPVLRFMILRWYFRLFVWYRLLWRLGELPLHLNLFHPDRAGGLGFLAGSVFAFAPVLVAQTILLAGIFGNRIWHAGAALPDFKMEILGATLVLMLFVLTPLCFFMAQLNQARRIANVEFGTLASHYVEEFRRKWIQGRGRKAEPLLGTSDIQSLADLANAYTVVSEMGILPFTRNTVLRLAVMIVLPLAPLTLTMVPLDQMIDRLIKLAL